MRRAPSAKSVAPTEASSILDAFDQSLPQVVESYTVSLPRGLRFPGPRSLAAGRVQAVISQVPAKTYAVTVEPCAHTKKPKVLQRDFAQPLTSLEFDIQQRDQETEPSLDALDERFCFRSERVKRFEVGRHFPALVSQRLVPAWTRLPLARAAAMGQDEPGSSHDGGESCSADLGSVAVSPPQSRPSSKGRPPTGCGSSVASCAPQQQPPVQLAVSAAGGGAVSATAASGQQQQPPPSQRLVQATASTSSKRSPKRTKAPVPCWHVGWTTEAGALRQRPPTLCGCEYDAERIALREERQAAKDRWVGETTMMPSGKYRNQQNDDLQAQKRQGHWRLKNAYAAKRAEYQVVQAKRTSRGRLKDRASEASEADDAKGCGEQENSTGVCCEFRRRMSMGFNKWKAEHEHLDLDEVLGELHDTTDAS